MSRLQRRIAAAIATTNAITLVTLLVLLDVVGAISLEGQIPTLALLVGILLGVLLAAMVASRIALMPTAHALRQLVDRASDLGRGAGPRHGSPNADDLGSLAGALEGVAAMLGSQIAALEAERSRLAVVLAIMSDGVIAVEDDGAVALINDAAARLLGIRKEGAEGRRLVDVVRDHELVAVARKYLRDGPLRDSERPPIVIDLGHPRRHVQVVATPIPPATLGRASALLLLQDVTQLRRADAVRREFVANVSHELRTPVAGLKALAETLESGALDEPVPARQFLSQMMLEIERLAQMVEELLELARLESGQFALAEEAVDLQSVVAHAVGRLLPHAERRAVVLYADTLEIAVVLHGDASRLERALINLLDNAIKFTPPGGDVRVRCAADGPDVVISVSDTGKGIPEDELPRIFERFYKADHARSSPGTGLGLAIAKHTVEAHGGRIWAESVEGRGSTFFISLPISHSQADANARPTPARRPRALTDEGAPRPRGAARVRRTRSPGQR
ncbi:MAG: PAS domain-containing protein [Chloroflexi bacterium]|nr:PAS domain-containing protein [Chloroflexota bacterium]